MDKILGKHWHHMPIEEVTELLETNTEKGLDLFEIEERKKRFGSNEISKKKGYGPIILFLMQFHQTLIYILLAAALITAILGEWVDAGVIFGVVLINAVMGFIQESKAIRAIEALAKAMSSECIVLRAKNKTKISSREIVPGDIVFLQSGDRVPADMRLFYSRDLQVDESALTGESLPISKSEEILAKDTFLSDRKNMVYSSSLVTYGTGTGIVVATGDKTEIGRISELLSTIEVPKTPLMKKLAQFSNLLLVIIISLAFCTFLVGLLRGEHWFDMFMAAVALSVGAIPEGLPAALTITLAIGVSRMAKRKAIIRKLPAVETLGSTTVICSDKTGTLTQNQMTVTEIYSGGKIFTVSGSGYDPTGEILYEDKKVDIKDYLSLQECLKCGILCNSSEIKQNEKSWTVDGDPTEGALITAAMKGGLSLEKLNKDLSTKDKIPFESQHQYMASLHEVKDKEYNIVYIKGSIEVILSRCEKIYNEKGEQENIDKSKILALSEKMAEKGLRVLAFGYMKIDKSIQKIKHSDIMHNIIFIGLQGMIDPPRNEAKEAIAKCKTAGIKVKMITGDHPITAGTIARQLGLCENEGKENKCPVLTGKEIMELSDSELIEKVNEKSVFARVLPEQKLRLVEALQARGEVAAMTGDGVNDAPALRRADIGISMGITGTEVAKEASDMVLTDDNFSSIEAAVEEGRGVFDNITKFIVWTIPTNIGEGLVILAAIIAGATLPILPVQILYINMTTALLLGLMLAFEKKEQGIMERPPRNPKTPIITKALMLRIILVSVMLLAGAFGFFELALRRGEDIVKARTMAVNIFVFGEMFYLFNCRSLTKSMFQIGFFSNIHLIFGVICMTILQILLVYVPLFNKAFKTCPISLTDWLHIIGVSLLIYIIIGLEKAIGKKLRDN